MVLMLDTADGYEHGLALCREIAICTTNKHNHGSDGSLRRDRHALVYDTGRAPGSPRPAQGCFLARNPAEDFKLAVIEVMAPDEAGQVGGEFRLRGCEGTGDFLGHCFDFTPKGGLSFVFGQTAKLVATLLSARVGAPVRSA
jgi:hypothetical protein